MRLVLCLVGALLTSSAYSTQVIQWNYNNKAKALGSGCNKRPGQQGDTDFISAGNEVSVIFSQLGVELTGHSGGKRAAKKTCRIIIPTKVRAGYYIGELNQTLTYGYERNRGTEGKVAAVSKFYRRNAGKIIRKVPSPGFDRWSEPFAEASARSFWRVNPSWCKRRDYKGNFKTSLTVNGYRRSTRQDIVIQIDGHDIRFDAVGKPLLCP